MASLRELKDRIASVRGTLKITSAMKLIASSKLHKAQQYADGLRRYGDALSDVARTLPSNAFNGRLLPIAPDAPVAIVALASNTSLCGAFNANVVRQALREVENHPGATVFAIGRKMADAMRRAGYFTGEDFNTLVTLAGFQGAAALADRLMAACAEGKFSRVILVYTHCASLSRQEVRVSDLLPFAYGGGGDEADMEKRVLYEPAPAQIARTLLPALIRLKLRTVCIDSFAAECAARTLAMQVATDNAEALLSELVLEYNKGRQQKITAEILELLGGQSL
ncbi:MAG: ATP synthase F1 subunit gamma [Bacteroidales bacterium]|nr:ATP synthase F1 subunit gamma [Bacteroidales bacterium]